MPQRGAAICLLRTFQIRTSLFNQARRSLASHLWWIDERKAPTTTNQLPRTTSYVFPDIVSIRAKGPRRLPCLLSQTTLGSFDDPVWVLVPTLWIRVSVRAEDLQIVRQFLKPSGTIRYRIGAVCVKKPFLQIVWRSFEWLALLFVLPGIVRVYESFPAWMFDILKHSMPPFGSALAPFYKRNI